MLRAATNTTIFKMNPITLTAADSISYPEWPNEYFAVPNDRIGTMLRPGEGLMVENESLMGGWRNIVPEPTRQILSQKAKDAISKFENQCAVGGEVPDLEHGEVVWRPGQPSAGALTAEQEAYIAKEFPPGSDGYVPDRSKALTYDDGKPPLATLPWKALREVAMVQAYGARKYDANNWRKGMEATRNVSCAMRHIADYLDGVDKDHESGRHALGHAACRILFLLENIIDGTAKDDRFKQP